MKPRMKLRIKLTRSNETKQVTFKTNRSGNAVLTGTCVGAQDYYLKLEDGRSIDVSERATGLTVNLVFPHSNYITKSIADGYKMYGDDSPFITMVIECKPKEPTEGNIIIMEDDIDSVYYEAWSNDDTFVNEGEIEMLFNKKAGTKGASGEAYEAGVLSWFNRKVTHQY
jgi:hypothetical protein